MLNTKKSFLQKKASFLFLGDIPYQSFYNKETMKSETGLIEEGAQVQTHAMKPIRELVTQGYERMYTNQSV